MQDWLWMTAGDLGRAIERGEIGPVALCETYLDTIQAHPDRDRIYSAITADRALDEARAAEHRAAAGLRRGPLDGVPISWKDLFDSAGTSTEAGSKLLAGRVPARDARVLETATQAGLVCLGKTHMSELAFSGLGLNPMTATPPNRHGAGLAPGGSSSGAAVSVALGLAACGIGSDTGGSVRVPSAWNDLVGLKTTAGRLPLDGVVPLCEKFDTVGPLARSVEDCALMLAALEGGRAADLHGATPHGLHLAALQTGVFDDIREGPENAWHDAVGRLRTAGAEVVELDAPEVAEALPMSGVLFTAEAYGIWAETIEAAPDKMFAPIRERFRGGRDVAAAEYVAAWRRLDVLRQAWHTRVAGFDAVLMPTAPNLPPDCARLLDDSDYYVTENLLTLRNTRVANLMGLPAVTLPTRTPACGLMLCGRPHGEEALLRVAAAAEMALR